MENKPTTNKPGRPISRPGVTSTKEKILAVAIDLFAENGYKETSLREIAHDVGITEGAVYKHYQSKESILLAIFNYLEEQIYSPLPPASIPGRSIFRDLLEMLPDYLLSNPRVVKISQIMISEMHANQKVKDYLHASYGIRSDNYTESLLQQQIESGKLRPCNAHSLSIILNAFRFGWIFRNFILESPIKTNAESIKAEMNNTIALLEEMFKNSDL